MVVNLMMINHTQRPIKNIPTVDTVTNWFVVMMIITVNQFKYIEDLRPHTNLWKRCWKRLIIVKI